MRWNTKNLNFWPKPLPYLLKTNLRTLTVIWIITLKIEVPYSFAVNFIRVFGSGGGSGLSFRWYFRWYFCWKGCHLFLKIIQDTAGKCHPCTSLLIKHKCPSLLSKLLRGCCCSYLWMKMKVFPETKSQILCRFFKQVQNSRWDWTRRWQYCWTFILTRSWSAITPSTV